MKSISVKKIAAIGAGAALFGAALAGAVTVDSTGLSGYKFFTNGEPAVKIVVGSKAQPSDAVAAANIAVMVGNLAYTDDDVNVDTTGVSCAAGTTGGQCAVDAASKKVSLTVTVPGASSSTSYLMKTYINDNLDNNVDTARNTTSSYDGTLSGTSQAKTLTKDSTAVLSIASDGKISNHKNIDVKQEQKVYVYSQTNYDSSSGYKAVIAQNVRGSYVLSFTPNPMPICWDTTVSNYSACSESDRLDKTHTKLSFLGEDWVVVSYSPTNGSSVTSLTLGKETGYNPYMNIDDVITAPNGAKIVLKSVTPFAYTSSNVAKASFEVTSASGVVTIETISDGGEKEVAGVTVKVNNVFPGVNNVNYADVSLYSDKITLSNGQEIDSDHKYWYARIGASTLGSTQAIKNLSVYSTRFGEDDAGKKYKAGEYATLIRGADAFRLTYKGLTTATYDTLAMSTSGTVSTAATLYTNGTSNYIKGRFVVAQSGISNAFQPAGYASVDNVYVLIANQSGGAPGANDNTAAGAIYFRNSATGDMVYYGSSIEYWYSSTESATLTTASATGGLLVMVEEFTKENLESGYNKQIAVYVGGLSPTGSDQFQFANSNATTTADKFYYNTTGCTGGCTGTTPSTTVDEGQVSDRGVIMEDLSSSSVTLKYPKEVVRAEYTFSASGTTSTAGSVVCTDVAVGGTCNIDTGYVATVDAVGATAGGAAGACVLSGVSDVAASPSTAAKVAALNTASAPIVVLDSQASATEPLIVVGGPLVNSVASGAAGTSISSPGSDAVVAVEGSKIIVAGYTAADTTAAANALINWLAQNRGTVRA